jgi:hypothetical protein
LFSNEEEPQRLIGKSIGASAQREQKKKCQSKIFARAFVLIKAQAQGSEGAYISM